MAKTGTKRKMSESLPDNSKDADKHSEFSNQDDGTIKNSIIGRKEVEIGTERERDPKGDEVDVGIENCLKQKGLKSSSNKNRGPTTRNGRKGQNDQKADDDDEFCVESIRDMKIENEQRFFLIKWLDFDEKYNTWEPETNMEGSHTLISEFMSEYNKAQKLTELKPVPMVPISQPLAKKPKLVLTKNADQQMPPPAIKKPAAATGAIPCDPNLQKTAVALNHRQQKNVPPAVFYQRQQNSGPPILGSMGQIRSQQKPRPNNQEVNNKQLLQYSNIKVNYPRNVMQLRKQQQLQQQERSKFALKLMEPKSMAQTHVFRLWMNHEVHLLQLNPHDLRDEFYNVIITEDVDHLSPTYFYGAAEAVDGQKYCLVQFEGHAYVDVVPPLKLFKHFPGVVESYVTMRSQLSTAL